LQFSLFVYYIVFSVTMKINALHGISLVTAVIETLFFGGIIFGWSSLSYVLQSENYFGYLCSDSESVNNLHSANSTFKEDFSNATSAPFTLSSNAGTTVPTNIGCKERDEMLQLVFTIASVALSFSTLPNGFMFDKFGTWVSRVIAILLFTCGCVLMAFSSMPNSWLLFPAMCCFSIGGIVLLLTNMQLGNLFGSTRSSIITLLSGALDSSSFVFLLVKLAYESGISLSTIFQFIAMCTIFQWLRTILVMPKMHIPFPLPTGGFKFGLYDCTAPRKKDLKKLNLRESPSDTADEMVNAVIVKQSFSSCICTLKFWTNTMHFSLLQLRNYFFLGTFVTWMAELLPDDNTALGKYINAFGICQFFGVVTAPLNGFLIDGMKHWFSKYSDVDKISSAKAIAVSAFTTSTLAVLFSITVAIPNAGLQYVSFVLQVIFRSFLYGGNASFVAFSFPVEHFGSLYGATMTIAGILVLVQFPLFSLVLRVFKKDFLPMNVAFIVVCASTYIHPALLFFRSREKSKQTNAEAQELQMLAPDLM